MLWIFNKIFILFDLILCNIKINAIIKKISFSKVISMKKTIKYVSFVLSIIIAFGCCCTAFSAAELDDDSQSVKAIYEKALNGRTVYYDENNNEISVEQLNDETKDANQTFPQKYDLRDCGRVTQVKNQGEEGYCWAFASVASMESSILSQNDLRDKLGENPQDNLNLSEAGLVWYIHTGIPDKSSPFYGDYIKDDSKGSNGGTSDTLAISLNSGYGAYPQSLCPYYDVKNGFSETLRFYSDYRLKEYSELSNNISDLKARIIENGAVTICYPNSSLCYSSDYANYYSNDESPITGQSHLIAVIGWDDNYSGDNFTGYSKPKNNGAWLCKNSWGENYGDNGYVWISYETTGLVFSQYIMQSNDSYDKEYQNCLLTFGTGYNYDGAANIFTAETDEQLKQISFKTLGAYDYTASVYALDVDFTNPKDGTLLTSLCGKVNNKGIHYIDITDSVYLTSGQKFSVIIESNNDSGFLSFSNGTFNNDNYKEKNCYTLSKGKWSDIYDQPAPARSYASIKAFTSYSDKSEKETELKNAITKAENIDESKIVFEYYAELLNKEITASKALLESRNASVQDMNNAIILLKYYEEKALDAPYEINCIDDYAELTELCENGGLMPSRISLNTDLDFKDCGLSFKPICNPQGNFYADFYGNGHTISNISLEPVYIGTVEISGLFGTLQGARIYDLTVENAEVDSSNRSGALCATAQYATISNCTVRNSVINYNYFTDNQSSGAICGEAWYTNFIGCKSEGNTVYGINAGAFAFSVDTTFTECTQSGNKVYSTAGVSVFDNEKAVTKNLYFIQSLEYSDLLVEIQDDFIRASSLLHTITSCTSDTVGIIKNDNYYYIDKASLSENDFVELEIDFTDSDNSYGYKVNLIDKSLILTSINFTPADTITIPSTYLSRQVSELSDTLFTTTDVSEVKTLVLSDGITDLKDLSIKTLSNLENLCFGNDITEIPDRFASGLYNLRNITLGSSVEKIGKYAFYDCHNLSGIEFPDSVRIIDDYAFVGTTFDKVLVGKNVEQIGVSALGCFNYALANRGYNYVRNPYFVINGYSSSNAEEYALKNGFNFVDLTTHTADMEQSYTTMNGLIAGDINLDNRIDVNDATLLQCFIAGNTELNDFQYFNAMVTSFQSNISINNVTEIQRYLIGEIDTLAVSSKG